MDAPRILAGVVVAPHGVRGEVKVKSFTDDPCDIARYELTDKSGTRRFTMKRRGMVRDLVIARVEGVETRAAAEAMKGTEFFIARSALPKAKRGEFYVADLIGMTAVTPAGAVLGAVTQVLNFGAGDILEIAAGDTEILVPFTKRAVPAIDVEARRVTVDPPVETGAP